MHVDRSVDKDVIAIHPHCSMGHHLFTERILVRWIESGKQIFRSIYYLLTILLEFSPIYKDR